MTFVVELRELKKGLPRPVTHFWKRSAEELCVLRVRLALLGLLSLSFDYPVDASVTASGALALLCGVLSAALSATFGLLCDASSGLSGLFSADASPAFQLGQGLRLCFGEPVFPFDICAAGGPLPRFSGHAALALVACAFLLFGCGLDRILSSWADSSEKAHGGER